MKPEFDITDRVSNIIDSKKLTEEQKIHYLAHVEKYVSSWLIVLRYNRDNP